MNITFDPAKDKINRAKHGVSLALASEFEWCKANKREVDFYAQT